MLYQSCSSVGDSYEKHTIELFSDSDAIEKRDAEDHPSDQPEYYYLNLQVEWAIAHEELHETNDSLTKITRQIETELWSGAEWTVL
ncbi:MAG: hypothetical protein KME11_14345 [Timaviella obliquedivisa GSE-PSE-MK23-08B]|jgi:hypothetical protein|nr:hypothetical protein [Timaviella obliquedivisa GSE-PSE-MK23-08B]